MPAVRPGKSRKKIISVLLVLLVVLNSAACFADSVSIFAATDRHEKYETSIVEESPPEDAKSKRPKITIMPIYDEDGNLIWHNNLPAVLDLVAGKEVVPEVVLLGGDNVGDGGPTFEDATGYPVGSPYFSMKSVDAEISAAFGEKARPLYTYGSHDNHATDDYNDVFFSGPVRENGYYIYGISFAQMRFDTDRQALAEDYAGKDLEDPHGFSAETATADFLSWVNGLDDHLPIVVMSHMPLHAIRGDNAGAWTWTKALNIASESHDIIFLWGHNHTVERGREWSNLEHRHYLVLPGEKMTVQSCEVDQDGKTITKRIVTPYGDDSSENDLITKWVPLGFLYMNAGYITNGAGTLLTFSGSEDHWEELTVERVALTAEEASEPWQYVLRSWEE